MEHDSANMLAKSPFGVSSWEPVTSLLTDLEIAVIFATKDKTYILDFYAE